MKKKIFDISERCYNFALDIINLSKDLLKNNVSFILGKQLIRSGTSIGANIQEAQSVSSRKDFIYKMTISQKEAKEIKHWLSLIKDSSLLNNLKVALLLNECEEISSILTTIVKKSKTNENP